MEIYRYTLAHTVTNRVLHSRSNYCKAIGAQYNLKPVSYNHIALLTMSDSYAPEIKHSRMPYAAIDTPKCSSHDVPITARAPLYARQNVLARIKVLRSTRFRRSPAATTVVREGMEEVIACHASQAWTQGASSAPSF